MRVLIYGGTGSQMRPLVGLLREHGHLPHVLTRNGRGGEAIRALGGELIEGDLESPATLAVASEGMDAVAFMIPAFLSDPSKALMYADSAIRAAVDARVQLIVWNTSARMPGDGEDRSASEFLFAVTDLLKASGIPFITIAPTTYMENLLGPWTADAVRQSSRLAYPVLADRKMGWIASRDICALVRAALERPTLAGRVFRVSGIEVVKGPELAQAFSEVLGRPIEYYAMSGKEMGAALDAAFGPGAGEEVAEQYSREQTELNPPDRFYDMAPVLKQLPVRMTTIREWVRSHAGAFAPPVQQRT